MRGVCAALFVVLLTSTAGCGGSEPAAASPSPVIVSNSSEPPAGPGACRVGFDELTVNHAAFTSHTGCGLSITATAASWLVSTTYGHPAPFIEFGSAAGSTTVGEVTVSGGGRTFAFTSLDIYSSTTKIPYEIKGTANGAVLFTIAKVQGNTYGNFATVVNPQPSVLVDTLRIRLTNAAAPCCSNPMGLDELRVIR
ncbi:MAG: hypothetical protein V7647_3316 [Acidobacteriota bacterium]